MGLTAKQILTEAADRLDAKGWFQGSYAADEYGRRGAINRLTNIDGVRETCVVGAIRMAADPMSEENDAAAFEAKDILRKHIGCENLSWWNDEDGRTVGDVVSALRSAAK